MKQILIPLFLGAAVFQGLAQSCVATASLTVTINNNCTKLAPKAFLQGPYVAANTAMSDNLRTNNLIPTTSPYAADAATADASVVQNPTITALNANANAIVDWVLVELRDKTTPTTVLGSAAALIQRDGDIVAVDGASPVVLNVPAGNDYYVAVKHRNHLGVMTGTAVTATAGATAVVDFTTMANGAAAGAGSAGQSWGSLAQRDLTGGKFGMVSGNTDSDTRITPLDYVTWTNQNGKRMVTVGYLTVLVDSDMDGRVTPLDYVIWTKNNGKRQNF
jgi:hypothetical protein